MKYLYLIMRLFKCPHRYQETARSQITSPRYDPMTWSYDHNDKKIIGTIIEQTCQKCGKKRITKDTILDL